MSTATGTPTVSPSASPTPTRTPAPASIGGTYEAGTGNFVFTGTGTPGETVHVSIDGSPVGGSAVVQPDGSWALGPVAANPTVGQVVTAHSSSPTGPSAGGVTVVAAGGPAVATGTQSNVAGGATVITASGNPGEVLSIVDAGSGRMLGSVVILPDGQAAVTLNQPVPPGATLQLISNGKLEDTLTVGAAGSPPQVQQGAVLVEGSTLTGTGVPGAQVQVVDDEGRVLGSATVAGDGTWEVPVNGAASGVGVKVIQDGVETRLPQSAQRLGDNRVFLSQNVFRPNLGGSLDIGFKAVADERITVKVFNLAGETVKLVAAMEVRAGVLYALRWDGRNDGGEGVAAGVYVVSAHGPKTRILKKVVVLK